MRLRENPVFEEVRLTRVHAGVTNRGGTNGPILSGVAGTHGVAVTEAMVAFNREEAVTDEVGVAKGSRAELNTRAVVAPRDYSRLCRGGGPCQNRTVEVHEGIRAVREQRVERGPTGGGGSGCRGRSTRLLAIFLEACEEEGLVLDDGAAKGGTPNVLGAGKRLATFLDCRVEALRSGSRVVIGDHVDNRTGCAAKFCILVRSLDTGLLLHGGKRDAESLTGHGDVVVLSAVN